MNECVQSVHFVMNPYDACVLNRVENNGSLMLHLDYIFVSELYIDPLDEYMNVIEIAKTLVIYYV